MALGFLANCTHSSGDIALIIDPEPVKVWCKVGDIPEPLPNGLWSCTAVDEATGAALLKNKCLIYWKRGVSASEVNCEY